MERQNIKPTINEIDLAIIRNELLNEFDKKSKDQIDKLREEFEDISKQIFQSGKFIIKFKQQMTRTIEQEIKVQVINSDLHKLVGELIKSYIKDNLKKVVKDIVESLIKDINKKLDKEYEITKELTYSINAEIKHTLMKLPISANTEMVIKEKIKEKINNLKINKKDYLQLGS